MLQWLFWALFAAFLGGHILRVSAQVFAPIRQTARHKRLPLRNDSG